MSIFRVWAALSIVLAFTAPVRSSTWPRTLQVPRDFVARINQYVEVHRLVTAPLGQPGMCSDPEELRADEGYFATLSLTS